MIDHDQPPIPVAGLWISKSSKGNTYLSGPFGDARLLCFKNDGADDSSNAPDWTAHIGAGEYGPDNAGLYEIGGLWINEGDDGQKYMAGYLGQSRMLVYRNHDKPDGSNAPDYEVFVKPKADRDDDGRDGQEGDAGGEGDGPEQTELDAPGDGEPPRSEVDSPLA